MVITCPGCNKNLVIPDTNPLHVRCRHCNTAFTIEYSEPVKITDIQFPLNKVKGQTPLEKAQT